MVTTFSSTRAFYYCFPSDDCCLTITCLKLLNVDRLPNFGINQNCSQNFQTKSLVLNLKWPSCSLLIFLLHMLMFTLIAILATKDCYCLSEVFHLQHLSPSICLQARLLFGLQNLMALQSSLVLHCSQQSCLVKYHWAWAEAELSISWSLGQERHRNSFEPASHYESQNHREALQISVRLRRLLAYWRQRDIHALCG